jgi:flagellar hook-basal body complex protein FliE
MAIPFNAATSAYGRAAQLINEAAKTPVAPTGGGGTGDFGSVLADAVQGMVDSGKVADQKAMNLVNGNGDVIDVVTAISQTELAIETMVTVRDRVISAYEEIMRMPI